VDAPVQWYQARGRKPQPLVKWSDEDYRQKLILVTPDGWNYVFSRNIWQQYLPDPGREWTLIRDTPEGVQIAASVKGTGRQGK